MEAELVKLFKGSPYLPRARDPEVAAMRDDLRQLATLRTAGEWSKVRLIFADRLDDAGDPEVYVARWPWRPGLKESKAGYVTRWVVEGLPAGALPAAKALCRTINVAGFLHWMPGELKLVSASLVPAKGPTRDTVPTVALAFTDLRGRSTFGDYQDVRAVPGGFPGLAWLASKMKEGTGG